MMDILPTGSNRDELIYIETECISFTIKGKAVHPRIDSVISASEFSKIRVLCRDQFIIEEKGRRIDDANRLKTQNLFHLAEYKINPMFYEQQNYEVIVESSSNSVVEFWHDNINIRNKVTPVGRSGKAISGIVNFGNEIGLSDMEIRINGNLYLRITIEVYPTKIQYQKDYLALIADVTDEIYNLVFDFLKKTYINTYVNNKTGSSLTEFFSIIRILFEQFINATDIILNRPQHELQSQREIVANHKIKHITHHTIKWLERHPENLIKSDEIFIADKALSIKKQVSYNTVENRLVKHILNSTMKRLIDLKNKYIRLSRSTDYDTIKEIDAMINGLYRRTEFSFLKDVGQYSLTTSMSLVFSMAPGYKELYKYYIMLRHGLSLDGDIFHISVKDLASLYEYWCFIKLNRIMKERYKLVKQDVLRIDSKGIFVTLKKGSESKVMYENPKNGEKIELSYNPKLTNLPTTAQRPDNVLSLIKKGKVNRYNYVFDAKYKINPSVAGSPYSQLYGTPGPEEEDINIMHRYRDAIVAKNINREDFERSMFGAYILFPYDNEEEYENHKFNKSIESLNIGALPFLPSTTRMVTELLDDLIADSPDSAFERATLPIGIEEKLQSYDLSLRDVMVGTLRNKEQYDICLKHRFYHIPVNRVSENRVPLHYIALYKADNLFGSINSGIKVYGEVLGCSKVYRSAIKEIPTSKNNDELYYRFDIKDWIYLDNPIKVKEYGPRANVFTNLFLLENSEFFTELLIKSKEEFRLYYELKRLYNKLTINNLEDSIEGFEFEGANIIFRNNEISVHTQDNRHNRYEIKQFALHPRNIFNNIRRFIAAN